MLELLTFKFAQLAILIIFTVFISDLRKKKQRPLIKQTHLKILKIFYLIPIIIYSYTIMTLSSFSYFDILALVTTFIGTTLVVISKKTLGDKHTWAGYCHKTIASFRAEGIYSYIRHPLYTGIFIFSMGGFFTFILNPMWFFSAIVVISIISFLAIIAKRETAHLSEKFGEPFKEYKKQVHPFLPLRRFKQVLV